MFLVDDLKSKVVEYVGMVVVGKVEDIYNVRFGYH